MLFKALNTHIVRHRQNWYLRLVKLKAVDQVIKMENWLPTYQRISRDKWLHLSVDDFEDVLFPNGFSFPSAKIV